MKKQKKTVGQSVPECRRSSPFSYDVRMKVLLFGASGMIGQSVLRECLLDPAVTSVLSVGRTAMQRPQAKFHEMVQKDMTQLAPIEPSLIGFDACFFCLGISSVGKTEAEYTRITYGLTLSVARTLARLNPRMTFVYVSAQGTDSSEKSAMMWARVRGKTENDLQKLPFKAYSVRPGFIQPLHGIKSKTALYQIPYMLFAPLLSFFPRFFPQFATTSERLGRAMIAVAQRGYPKPILESRDINVLGTR
jgi:uncharacterized protein YbjT (DUF2867 family)